jgi:hypothetical protein
VEENRHTETKEKKAKKNLHNEEIHEGHRNNEIERIKEKEE